MSLTPRHRAHIQTSAISDEIIAERAYHSIADRSALSHMAPSQRLAPAIGIPVYRLGEPYTVITRPDAPRTEKKEDKVKTIKYEWPAGVPLVLDVLPRFRDALTDTSRALWLTEGAKKADALASVNPHIVPISINGVWGWTDGKDADGNRYLLPDFKKIALRGRRVVLAFDSDYQVNEHVRMALDEFAKALEARGAVVGILQLPHGDTKLGVDDALADGWTSDELAQAVHWRDGTTEGYPLLPSAELERLRRDNEQLRERMQWMRAVLGNKELPTGQRLTLLFTGLEAWYQQKKQAQPEVKVMVCKIADESGQSPDVVGRHIKQLERAGAWARDVRHTRDAKTGDVRTEVRLTPAPVLERPLFIKPPEAKNWGGKRLKKCDSCGSEEFIERKTTITVCQSCGVVHSETTTDREVSLEIRHDPVSGSEKVVAVARHDELDSADCSTLQVAGSGAEPERPPMLEPKKSPMPQVAGSESTSLRQEKSYFSFDPTLKARRNVGSATVPQVAGSGTTPKQPDKGQIEHARYLWREKDREYARRYMIGLGFPPDLQQAIMKETPHGTP